APFPGTGSGPAPPTACAECGDPARAGDDFMRLELRGGSGGCSWQVGHELTEHSAGAVGLRPVTAGVGACVDLVRG
ncbi:hypothetical protein P7K49_027025, partial [Saguinus oedipus]